jgi:hypothetical protein
LRHLFIFVWTDRDLLVRLISYCDVLINYINKSVSFDQPLISYKNLFLLFLTSSITNTGNNNLSHFPLQFINPNYSEKEHTHISRISLPSCRNYWGLQEVEQPTLHQFSDMNHPHKSVLLMHPNPNQKYHKRRDLPDGEHINSFRYKIQESISPFRGVARLIFWISFALILIFIGALIITVFCLGLNSKQDGEKSSSGSIILNALFITKHKVE